MGYKSFELGIFSDKDPKLAVIKRAIKKDLIAFFEDGVDWLIFTGNLGFEVWVLDVAKELQQEYDFSMACLFLFEDQGQSWSESNQEKLARFKQLDFVKYSYPSYQGPSQLKNYNRFLLENTDRAYLFYDRDHETSLKYLYQMMQEVAYEVKELSFDRLNEVASED
ncbi:putative phage-like protein YoqJ [Streptococcus saliviloxodontae]|uniref:Phage-like protein YoqJ n=2 Tax=Streptococcus saliviloxodontae TaxID=1349416 RepID=A0ABS2PND1_9STRE|nr:putative phage-like protein YoqJ [Streptococcus saliviloxodontae]